MAESGIYKSFNEEFESDNFVVVEFLFLCSC